ncbi:hypothetical protein K457DRAFT_138582 [Linnemannia elongata AG-77]|uniref:Uncharacterized protein n=1 Tax=Linnemannia elongata AG-77 TaxID=1314771 RepID=A0A197JT60_9FUNG|nr:hypothetical protein K457DRAFT_138582 [Linnemannia elongata AG-77]
MKNVSERMKENLQCLKTETDWFSNPSVWYGCRNELQKQKGKRNSETRSSGTELGGRGGSAKQDRKQG